MTFRPTDEQARAISCLDTPLCITAGAGSGKTRVLAERLVAAVEGTAAPESWTPAGVGEALVVTFTEKAAGEIAERVRRVFLEHGLVAEARHVDEAWISTIHGLCQRLLRTHALEAGLDPGFGVISAVDAGALREAVFDRVLREGLASGRAAELVQVYGVAGVQEHASLVHDRLRAMGATPGDVAIEDPVDPREVLQAARTALADWAGRLGSYPAGGVNLCRCADSVATAREVLEGLAAQAAGDSAGLARGVLRALHEVRLSLSVGGAKELVREISSERRELLDRAVRAVAVPLERSLLEVVNSFGEGYEAAKRDRAVLDFEDLQLRAVELLRTENGPAERYRTLFRLVMIDEFQDTNEVQTALADQLSHGDLCTVGDERQSIYSFRFADVDNYRRHTRDMLSAGAKTAALAVNFRSHGDVLAFVNAAFAAPGLFGPSFLRLEHGRDETAAPAPLPPGQPRVELLLVDRVGRAGDAARAVEADGIARRLRELVDAGVPQGGIVVLLRAMTHADEYAEALRRHDLDTAMVAGGSFFGRPEVEAVRAFLRAVSNALDDEALAVVLASDMTGMSDDGLIRLRRAAGKRALWHAFGTVELEATDAVATARTRSAILTARARQGRHPVAGIVHRACEELDYDLHLLASGPEGGRAYANVLKLARLAEEFERSGGAGVRDFVEHLSLKERFADREAPASIIDERVDAVRIMTVHAAKGLEFPVVALPELGRDPAGDRTPVVLEKEGHGARLALSLPDDGASNPEERRSAWMSEARERAHEREVEEEKRLLYVACTRAREALVLSGAGELGKPGGDRPLGWIRGAIGLDADIHDRAVLDVGGAPIAVRRLDGSAEASPPAGPRVRTASPAVARQDPPAPYAAPGEVAVAGQAAARPVSYSAMRLYGTCPLRYFATSVARLGRAHGVASHDPRRLGDAVHAALRLIGPGGEAPSPERLAAIARRWALEPDEDDRLRAAVNAFISSSVCREAHARGAPSHEVPFAVPLEGATLIGRLDLVFERSDTTVILDYKTGIGAMDPAASERHRAQADCYALAALAGGSAGVEVTFVGVEALERGEPRCATFRYDGADEPRLRASMGTRAAALVSGPYEPLASYDPAACDECPAARSVCPLKVPRRAAV